MSHYIVTWSIDVWGDTHKEAALEAWEAMRTKDTQATHLIVEDLDDQLREKRLIDMTDLLPIGEL